MSRCTIYEMNYTRLANLLGQPPEGLEPKFTYRLRSEGFMDLIVEKLSRSPEKGTSVLSLAHYFEQEGDLGQDPEMVIRVCPPGLDALQDLAPSTDPNLGRVEALIFLRASPPKFQTVYQRPNPYAPRLKAALNRFLAQWLRNLKKQGHCLVEVESSSFEG